MTDVTSILDGIQSGDPADAAQLLPLVYDDLRRLAAHRLAHEAPGQTLQPTALVHEAYLRLVGSQAGVHWDGRYLVTANANGTVYVLRVGAPSEP